MIVPTRRTAFEISQPETAVATGADWPQSGDWLPYESNLSVSVGPFEYKTCEFSHKSL